MRTSVPVVQVDDPPSLSHQLEGVPVAVGSRSIDGADMYNMLYIIYNIQYILYITNDI